jgi:hypothetical protein
MLRSVEAERARQPVAHARTYLLELHEREGWRALGYASWRVGVQAELGQGRSRVYQLLDAALPERVLLDDPKADGPTIVETIASEPILESHLREIAPLAKARRAWALLVAGTLGEALGRLLPRLRR